MAHAVKFASDRTAYDASVAPAIRRVVDGMGENLSGAPDWLATTTPQPRPSAPPLTIRDVEALRKNVSNLRVHVNSLGAV